MNTAIGLVEMLTKKLSEPSHLIPKVKDVLLARGLIKKINGAWATDINHADAIRARHSELSWEVICKKNATRLGPQPRRVDVRELARRVPTNQQTFKARLLCISRIKVSSPVPQKASNRPRAFERPRPKVEHLPLERLLFPPECQQRAGLSTELPADVRLREACWAQRGKEWVCIANPVVAQELADFLADNEGLLFDPLEVVRGPGKTKQSQPSLWVFGGFTRGAGYRIHGKIASVPCHVYEGGLEDAIFWSLSENHKNVQARGHGSARGGPWKRCSIHRRLRERVREAVQRRRRLAPGDSPRVPRLVPRPGL